MKTLATCPIGDDFSLFVAGQTVPPGTYRLVGSRREVRLDRDDILPATCDGRVAVYERRPQTWAEVRKECRQ